VSLTTSTDRPRVHCFIARVDADQRPVGAILHVTLETAVEWRDRYAIVGPDPLDMHDVAMWDRQRNQQRRA
jgi:hypothetical protein